MIDPVDHGGAGRAATGGGMKCEFKELVAFAEADQLGPVRMHFETCDGIEAAQDLARLVDVLASRNVPAMWNVLQSIHRWQR